jgi:hypothetical protein
MTGLKNFALDTSIYFGSALLSNDTLYNVQTVNIPGVDFSHAQVGGRAGALFNVQADTITFSDLNLSIIVDEQFKIWKEVMLKALKRINVQDGTFSNKENDSFIVIVDSQGNDLLKIWFKNSRIINVGDMTYTHAGENNLVLLDLSLKYDYFEIEEQNYIILTHPNLTISEDALVDLDGKITGKTKTTITEL